MTTTVIPLKKLFTTHLTAVVYVLAFTIPAIFSSPQLITGTIVNCLLFTASANLPKKALYPVFVLPSLGAITHGVLFGPQTIFLYYFLPFIWIGNYLLISVFTLTHNQNYLIRIGIASLVKYLALYFFALVYVQLNIVPRVFLLSMGSIQLITAVTGGLLSYLLVYFSQKHE